MSTGFIIALFVLGFIFLVLEIFVPGGVLGMIGIIALITGIISVADSVVEGMLYILIMFTILGILVFLSFRFPQTKRFWRKFTLNTRQSNQEGYVAPKPSYESYLGRYGTAMTQLRPAGTADFDGERLDVVTEGGFIRNGSGIKVIAVEGTRVIVREISDKP
ncbi:MAG: NfeD family protein [Desulfitobacteriaceae bacterium]